MAAGPTKKQVNTAARKALQRQAALRNGRYINATSTHYGTVILDSGIELSVSLLRASNGEACLLPLARRIGADHWKSGPLNFDAVIGLV